jgi:hypothetical protein
MVSPALSTLPAMHEHDTTTGPVLRRHEALAIGAPGLGAASSCTLSKELTEGPYWIENGLTRPRRAGCAGTRRKGEWSYIGRKTLVVEA